MSVCVLQVVTPDILDYTKYSIPNNLTYCLSKHYDLQVFHFRDKGFHPSWGKVIYLLDILSTKAYEIVFVLDADAFIVNKEVSIEGISLMSTKPIMVCENGFNGGGLINMGAMLVKSSEVSIKFFREVIDYVERNPELRWNHPFEQEAVNHLYEEWKDSIEVCSMNLFNSYWNHDVSDRSQFIYHFMGVSPEEKVLKAKTLYEMHG